MVTVVHLTALSKKDGTVRPLLTKLLLAPSLHPLLLASPLLVNSRETIK